MTIRPISAGVALVAALASISACKQEAPAPQASASAEASVGAAKQGISVGDGKLVLPAVKGRPGAAYFMLSNSDAKVATLTGIAIEGAAKAEMHETKGGQMAELTSAQVKSGEMLMFERGGKHVMVFDLAPTIKAGDAVNATLTFADGQKVTVALGVEAAGGASDHGAMH